jgi:predicted DNA-binding ribbon-helix-helix protein
MIESKPHAKSTLINRNLRVRGRRTSVRLERAMWDALCAVASARRQTVHDLATTIDQRRSASSLTSAIRSYLLVYFWRRSGGIPRPHETD